MQFKDLEIMPAILRALEEEQYTSPTPIQEEAIPVILSGRDLLGCAQTGTGKTAAFAIPTLQLLETEMTPKSEHHKIKALIITPTRELAIQIHESFCTYGRYTNLRCCVIFGGVSQKPQEEQLQQGVDILVATPGRLLDMMNQNLVDMKQIKILILDEADRMLDMGFIHDVKRIIAKTPAKKQTLLFSATIPPSIEEMVRTILNNPQKIAVTPVSSTVDTIQQYLYYVDKENKKELLIHLLQDKTIESVLIFTRTKHGADKVVKILDKAKIKAKAIHGDKSQGARQQALNEFKERKLRVLIATDIAARGIDIDELSHVINYDLPNIPETYVHRIGRTGRAGMGGIAISFCDFDEKEDLADIVKLIGKSIPEVKDHPYPLLRNYPAEKNTQPRRSPRQKEAAEDRPVPKGATQKASESKSSSQKSSANNPAFRQNTSSTTANRKTSSQRPQVQMAENKQTSNPNSAPMNTWPKNTNSMEKTHRNSGYKTSSAMPDTQRNSNYNTSSSKPVTQRNSNYNTSTTKSATQKNQGYKSSAGTYTDSKNSSAKAASHRSYSVNGRDTVQTTASTAAAPNNKTITQNTTNQILTQPNAEKKSSFLKKKFRMTADGNLKEVSNSKNGGQGKRHFWQSKKK